MSNAAHLLPARLRAAAAAIANARAARRGHLSVADVLDLLPQPLFQEIVEDAQAALDAAHEVAQNTTADLSAAVESPERRIAMAAYVGLDLRAQAVVILDVTKVGTIHVSTWAEGGGLKSRAVAEWAEGLQSTGLAVVPFQTVFGWGHGGRPTPLTSEQRASLSEAGRAYADRNTEGPAS